MKYVGFVFPLTVVAVLGLCGAIRAGESSKKVVIESDIDAPRLWAQTCSRCHNVRPASTYSDAQWDVIMHHMRVRAYLTVKESRAIADFLKEAN
ncbi:hypothetical protein ACXR0O_07410 [Verrucomicrobiota bacterium sgz303538]